MKKRLPFISKIDKKIAGILGLALLGQSDEITAQNFLPPLDDPFGLKYDTLYNTISADFVDIDGDGDLDFFNLGYNYDTDLDVYLYQENTGSAENPQYGPTQVNPFGDLTVANLNDANHGDLVDIDGDGDYDLITINFLESYYLKGIDIYENVGDAQTPNFVFQDSIDFGINSDLIEYTMRDIDFVDLDGDGDVDLVSAAVSYDYTLYEYDRVIVYAENIGGQKDVAFGPIQTNPFGLIGQQNAIVPVSDFGDLDGDGDLDMIYSSIAYENEMLTIETFTLENIGSPLNPSFGAPVPLDLGFDSGDGSLPTLVDLDNDGDADIFSNSYFEAIYDVIYQYFENDLTSSTDLLGKDLAAIELFPNPTVDELNIELADQYVGAEVNVKFYNALGQQYHIEKIGSADKTIQMNISDWMAGIYTVKLDISGQSVAKTFIKE